MKVALVSSGARDLGSCGMDLVWGRRRVTRAGGPLRVEVMAAVERAKAVRCAAGRRRKWARVLEEFARGLRERDGLQLRCAWCGRIDVGGAFVRPHESLNGVLLEGLLEHTTHGICPDCFERENDAATAVRRQRESQHE